MRLRTQSHGVLGPAAALIAAAGLAWPVWAQPVTPREPVERPAAAPSPAAKTPPTAELEVYEGRQIRRVTLRRPGVDADGRATGGFEALDSVSAQLVGNQLRAREGSPYVQETVTGDLTRINRLGRFAQVESRVLDLGDGTVELIYTLTPRQIVRDVQSVGNKKFTDAEIAAQVEILVDTPVDRYELDRACRRIERLYKEKGYYLAQVSVDQKELDESGIVLFQIREGERLKVTEIRFEGNRSFTPRELRSAVKTEEAWLLGRGTLDDDQLELDVAGVVSFYKDRGYLDVRVGRNVRPSLNGREAVVTFLVDEGQLYTLRKVTLFYPDLAKTYKTAEEAKGNRGAGQSVLPLGPGEYAVYSMGVFSPEQIVGLMEVKPGDVYSLDKLRTSMDAVRDAYGKLGYSDVEVIRKELRDPDEPVVDLLVQVRERQKYRVGEVIIQGNDITQDKVIRREVQLKPDRPADTTAIIETQKRLARTRLFDTRNPPKVTLQAPDPMLDPEHRDVLVEIEETNTGSINFGAQISSDGGVSGVVSVTQRNFDVADMPDSFGELFSGRSNRGAGQTFRAEVSPGTIADNYSLSLGEPSLLDTDYSGNAEVFFRSRDFDEYDEDRVGGRFTIGRRFGSRWNAAVPVRIERINLRGIEADNPVDYFDVRGANILTSVGVTLSRTSLDDPFRPGKGSRVVLGAEQVGALGGDFTYTALRAEHSVYMTVNEDVLGARTVLSLHTRASYIPQDKDEVPVFERFYMGGQQFRGFNYRAVSPVGIRNDTKQLGDDPVGGTWSFFWGAEINQPIFQDTVALVGFVDTGTVTDDVGFDDYRVSAGVGIRLYVPAISPAPLAFDFGFPIVSQTTDRERVFTFSLDLPF